MVFGWIKICVTNNCGIFGRWHGKPSISGAKGFPMNSKEVFSYYLAEEGDLILSCMIVVLRISPMEPMDVSHVRYA